MVSDGLVNPVRATAHDCGWMHAGRVVSRDLAICIHVLVATFQLPLALNPITDFFKIATYLFVNHISYFGKKKMRKIKQW